MDYKRAKDTEKENKIGRRRRKYRRRARKWRGKKELKIIKIWCEHHTTFLILLNDACFYVLY
jgi:hypothetical protein